MNTWLILYPHRNSIYEKELKKSINGFSILFVCDGGIGWGMSKSKELTAKGVAFLYNCKIILSSPSSGKI